MRAIILLVAATWPFLFATLSLAEKLNVVAPEGGEQVTAELSYGEFAELTVYLKSFGDMVEGFRITLTDGSGEEFGSQVSDANGEARFMNLTPGNYRLSVEKKKTERGGFSTVSVGDLRVKKYRK